MLLGNPEGFEVALLFMALLEACLPASSYITSSSPWSSWDVFAWDMLLVAHGLN
jgi:hypothetical protein